MRTTTETKAGRCSFCADPNATWLTPSRKVRDVYICGDCVIRYAAALKKGRRKQAARFAKLGLLLVAVALAALAGPAAAFDNTRIPRQLLGEWCPVPGTSAPVFKRARACPKGEGLSIKARSAIMPEDSCRVTLVEANRFRDYFRIYCSGEESPRWGVALAEGGKIELYPRPDDAGGKP